ncbi:MAG: hypothetical protein KAW12_08465 [Candidatus Aminicenantes bacterium]|nr:hypothetical protein [Candidatus Aminicenantes bacterium]
MKILKLFLMLIILTACLCAETVVLPDIMKPQRMYAAGEQLFITEGATIYIYSLKDYKLQKKFGRRGEGPGEFKESGEGLILNIKPSHFIVISSGRLTYFTRAGEYIKQVTLKNPRSFEFKAIGNRFVGTSITRNKDGVFLTVNFFDEAFKKGEEIYRFKHPFYDRPKPVNAVNLRVRSYYVHRDKIFIDDEKGAVNVLDDSGKKLYAIQPAYEKIKVTGLHKKRYMEIWKTNLKAEYEAFKNRLKFPSYFPYIRNFHIVDAKVYIITYKEKEGESELLVYDTTGKFLKRTFASLVETDMILPHVYNYYTISNGKIYILKDDEESEEWRLEIKTLL